jgi:hypothetical protein
MKNNEITQRKLIDGVKLIIQNDGLPALTMVNVSNLTGISQSVICSCFGGLEGLLQAYIADRDFWSNAQEPQGLELPMSEQVRKIITEDVTSFYNHCEMNAMLLNEIAMGNILVKNIIKEEPPVDNSAYYDIVSTLLQAGTDHLILSGYGTGNGENTPDLIEAEKDLMQSIGQIIDWTFG